MSYIYTFKAEEATYGLLFSLSSLPAGSAGPGSLSVLLGVSIPDVSKTHLDEILFRQKFNWINMNYNLKENKNRFEAMETKWNDCKYRTRGEVINMREQIIVD